MFLHVVVSIVHLSGTVTLGGGFELNYYTISANWTINGASHPEDYKVFLSSESFEPEYWDPSHTIELFPSTYLYSDFLPKWHGTVYFLALYNETLSSDAILQQYNKKLPNSLPVTR